MPQQYFRWIFLLFFLSFYSKFTSRWISFKAFDGRGRIKPSRSKHRIKSNLNGIKKKNFFMTYRGYSVKSIRAFDEHYTCLEQFRKKKLTRSSYFIV